MTGLNWAKVRHQSSVSSRGSLDISTEREWRENDRAARWLVKASEQRKPRRSKARRKKTVAQEAAE